MELIKATLNDAEILWKMQKIAFSELYEKYQDHDTSPANEPLEKMIERLEQDFTCYYFIVSGGDKVGAIRVVDMKNDSPKRVSPIFIMPEFRRKGYARTAMLEAENYRNLMCRDGIHPNKDGYAYMAGIWEKEIPKIKKEF